MDYQRASELELWKCCQRDDMKAYNELFHRQSPKLYKQAARYIVSKETAEELMLDLLFDLWQKRHQRDIQGDVSAYLYRCMRNMIVDHRRKNIPAMAAIDESILQHTLAERRQSDHALLVADAEKIYSSVLETMSPQRRRVFQLSREQNLTYAEIAREMNLSVNTVENYMAAALETFRNRTKGYMSVERITLLIVLLSC